MKFHCFPERMNAMFPLVLALFLATSCSNEEPEGAVGTDRMEEGTINAEGERVGADSEGSAGGTNSEIGAGGSNVDRQATAKIETARVEKKRNSDELNGLRSQLTAELEQVRSRLNDGSAPPEERQKDQARAATLAQGLERLDRAIEEIEVSADASWDEIKAHSDQELKDLRAWMEENEVKGGS